MRIHPTFAQIAKRTVLAFFTLIILLIVSVALFFAFFDLKGYAQKYSSEASGREISLGGDLSIDWGWVPKVTLTNLRIGNVEGGSDPQMATVERLVVSLDVKELLKGDTVLPELTLDKPDLLLEKDAKGNVNWHFGDNPEAAVLEGVTPDSRTDIPAIQHLVITGGRLRYKDAVSGVDIDSEISTVAGSADEKERIELSGKGTYQKQPFTLKLSGGSVLTLQDADIPYPLDLSVAVGPTSAEIHGTLMDPVQLKGLDLKLRLKGASMADLFPITGIALPPTPPYDVSGDLGYREEGEGGVWRFKAFKGKMGDSDLGGDLSWDTRQKRPVLYADFISKRLAFEDLGGLVGAAPEEKAIDPKQKQDAARKEASGRVLPDVPLDISRLKAMDAVVTFTGKQVISTGLPLDDFFLDVKLDNSLLKIHPVKFGTAGGDIEGNLTVNARVEPVAIDSDFQFRRLSLAQLFKPLSDKLNEPNLAKGYIGGRAALKGNGKSLRDMLATSNGTVGVGMEGGQLSNLIVEFMGLDVAESIGFLLSGDKPTKIRCVIGDFKVENGTARSNALVIDTTDTNVTGDGTINLKSEAMDITFNPHPKDPSLLSLRAPIHVKGTLGTPSVGVDTAALAARGGVVAALSVVLTPIGGLLGFIEPGLGKDSDCAGLITEMQANTGKKGSKALIPKNAGAPAEGKTEGIEAKPKKETNLLAPAPALPGRTPEPTPLGAPS